MSTPPTIAEELDRKALSALADVQHGLSTREVSLAAGAAAAQAIWNITSGLVPKDSMEVVADFSNRLQGALRAKNYVAEIAVLIGAPGGVYILTRQGSTVEVAAWMGSACTRKTFAAPDTEVHPMLWASQEFGRHYITLVKQGFTAAFKQ